MYFHTVTHVFFGNKIENTKSGRLCLEINIDQKSLKYRKKALSRFNVLTVETLKIVAIKPL